MTTIEFVAYISLAFGVVFIIGVVELTKAYMDGRNKNKVVKFEYKENENEDNS